MKKIYLLEVYTYNGTIKNTIDVSAFNDGDVAELVKKKIDKVNANSPLKAHTSISEIDLYNKISEIPVLNENN